MITCICWFLIGAIVGLVFSYVLAEHKINSIYDEYDSKLDDLQEILFERENKKENE